MTPAGVDLTSAGSGHTAACAVAAVAASTARYLKMPICAMYQKHAASFLDMIGVRGACLHALGSRADIACAASSLNGHKRAVLSDGSHVRSHQLQSDEVSRAEKTGPCNAIRCDGSDAIDGNAGMCSARTRVGYHARVACPGSLIRSGGAKTCVVVRDRWVRCLVALTLH